MPHAKELPPTGHPPAPPKDAPVHVRAAHKYDAIHRALLTGLLGNIGAKTDPNEYTGARNTKFHVFPGSGLFRRSPRWVVAAELVETTRLYARTCARILPEWIERLAGHLVHRSYTGPHWQAATAHVAAYEKVTLYGLPIVEKRLVHYGPIDPKASRDLFIQHALVEGEYKTHAPYSEHNRQLIAEIEKLEAKKRRRDLLAEPQTQYAFFDARVPAGIYNGPLFEKWRKEAERANPRLLHMSRTELMRHAAKDITPELYPDEITVAGLKVPLEYKLEPGSPSDGVTAVVPLAALNQLPAEPFEWLVPGLLREKITELIRSLPKQIRVNFVPAPAVGEAAAAALTPYEGSLLEALALYLGRRAGLPVTRDSFDPATLPEFMKMNFRVIDETRKEVAGGRDLNAIRQKLGVTAKVTFAALPQGQWHRDDLGSWDFGDLPERVEIRRHGLTLNGYPALVDHGGTPALRILDSPAAAALAMRGGLRRLFIVQIRREVETLERNIPAVDPIALHFAPLGSYKDLKAQMVTLAADRAFFGEAGSADEVRPEAVRTRAEFIRRADLGYRRLIPVGREIAENVRQILAEYQDVSKALSATFPPALLPAARDMREQLMGLVTKNFLITTPPYWLKQLPRFLRGISARLKKLTNAGLARDTANAAVVAPFQRQYAERLERHRKSGTIDPEMALYRWMLEELRVSLFAQELKTSIPISPKRLETQWAKVRP